MPPGQPPGAPPPVPGPPPGRPGRPVSVTLASALMILIGLLGLIMAITSLAAMNTLVNRFRERAADTDASPTDVDNLVGVVRVVTIVIAISVLLLAVLLILLAFGNLRGSNTARVLTWIVCVLGVLCGCCGVFGAFTSSRMTTFGTTDTDSATAEQLGRALSDSYPGWWSGVNGSLSILQVLGYIAVAVLLALPAANAYFRRPTR
jgi:phosphoglycerol transferase MdoB-like AlkP superfamily enzyme